jgi:hypothetical protein
LARVGKRKSLRVQSFRMTERTELPESDLTVVLFFLAM